MSIEIYTATEADIDQVYSIVEASAKWLEAEYGMTHWVNYYTIERIRAKFEHGSTIFVLNADGETVATATIGASPSEYYTDNQDGPDETSVSYLDMFQNPTAEAFYATALAVHPDYHGQGYAKTLLHHIEKFAASKGIEFIRFDARGDYQEVVTFYKKQGYKIVGEMPDTDSVYYLFEKRIG